MIITDLKKEHIYFKERQNELKKVKKYYKFDDLINLKFEPAKLKDNDFQILSLILKSILKKCNIVYVPYVKDVHTDHQIIAKAMKISVNGFDILI